MYQVFFRNLCLQSLVNKGIHVNEKYEFVITSDCITVSLVNWLIDSLILYTLEVSSRSSGYHGLVDEDKQLVDVTPKIRASGAEICAFRIVNKHHGETPFEVSVTSPAHPIGFHQLTSLRNIAQPVRVFSLFDNAI